MTPIQTTTLIPQFITRRQLAERWGVHVVTVMRNKQIKPLVLGPRLLRYRLEDVLAYEETCMYSPGACTGGSSS